MGGNVFQETSPIEINHIKPTVDNFFKELSTVFPSKKSIFSPDHFNYLGSAFKKEESNDLDLAIDISNILNYKNIKQSIKEWDLDFDNFNQEFNILKSRARTSTDDQLTLKALFKLISKKINNNSSSIRIDEKKVGVGQMFCSFPQYDVFNNKINQRVQIDFITGKIEWLLFSFYSKSYSSNVKGLHRTQLMLSAFQLADISFDHLSGIKDKNTKELLADNPDTSLKELSNRLGIKINKEIAEDYFSLHEVLKKNLSKEKYSDLLNCYFKILDSTRADIPENIQSDWIIKKETLGLSGKFLPENSKLRI
jgi:hypothetical protein